MCNALKERNGKEQMKCLRVIVLLLLAVAATHGQPVANIKGIKILSSTFDPSTRTAKLVFVNDSAKNITAWGYCVRVQNSAPGLSSHSFCTLIDPLITVIEEKIEMTKRPYLHEADCSVCRFVHPGEEKLLSSDFSAVPEVIGAEIEINLIAYGDGTAEALSNREGQQTLDDLTRRRQGALEVTQRVISIAQSILADSSNHHPAAAMIVELKTGSTGDAGLAGALDDFKKPERRRGNNREFIPDNEREYVERYLAEQRIWSAELIKNQIRGGR